MKAYKVLAMLAMPLLVGISSCTKEAEYNAAGTPSGAQVFFSNTSKSEYLLADGQTSVKIPVNRMKTDAALTVALTSSEELPSTASAGDEAKPRKEEAAAKVFTVPSTVTFEEGAEIAEVEITFNFSDITPDEDYIVNLELQDELTEYGDSKKQIVIKYAPWSDDLPVIPYDDASYNKAFDEAWATGVYTDNGWMGGKPYEVPVYRRNSLLDPTRVQYILNYWGDGINLIIDVDESKKDENGYYPLSIQPQKDGYFFTDYGEYCHVADAYTYWTKFRGQTTYEDGSPMTPYDDGMYSYYDPENGRFVIQMVYFISLGYLTKYSGQEVLQLDGFEKADYSVALVTAGTFADDNDNGGQVIWMQLGSDAAKVKYAVFPGSLTDEEVNEAADNIMYDKIDGIVETAETGNKTIDLEDEGEYTLVAVTLDENGQMQEVRTLHFNYEPASSWVDYRVGTYTYYGIFAAYDEATDTTKPYEDVGLMMQQNSGKPENFRIRNWGAGINFRFSFGEDGSVVVEPQYVGYDDPDYGPVYVLDMTLYTGDPKYGYSEYEPETGTFWFALAYVVLKEDGSILGSFWNSYTAEQYETFVITDAAVKARVDAAYYAAKAKGKGNKAAEMLNNILSHKLPSLGRTMKRIKTHNVDQLSTEFGKH